MRAFHPPLTRPTHALATSPGPEITAVQEALDVSLLAEAFEWAGDNDDTTAGQTYNLTNGDVFLWPNLWGAIAEVFGMVRTHQRPTVLTLLAS